MIPIARPLIGDEEKAAVLAVLESGQLAQGARVREFEARFADWCGAEHAVAVSSGTSALHLALLAHGIGPGDEVITPSFSFVASANCALFVDAQPVFADIEPAYFTLDPADVARRITPQTRAIIAVHLFGQPCDVAAITDLARRHDLVVIEDACQAHGARFRGRPVGSDGTACYSFYPTKNMTTGEGGMITTNDARVAERVRMLRDHGSRQRYEHEILGYNLRMTEIQAAIGLVQLPKLAAWNTQRRANAGYLTQRLAGLDGVVTPAVRDGALHVFHQYTLRVRNRDAAVEALRAQGVGAGVYYPTPIHQQPLYRRLSYDTRLPATEAASREVLSLPVHPTLTREELDRIVAAVAKL